MKQKKEKTWKQILASRNNVKNPSKAQLLEWAAENANAARTGENFPTINVFWIDANGNKRVLVRKQY